MKRFARSRLFNVLIVVHFLVATSLVLVFLLRSPERLGEESETEAEAEKTEEAAELGIKLQGMIVRGWDGDLLK